VASKAHTLEFFTKFAGGGWLAAGDEFGPTPTPMTTLDQRESDADDPIGIHMKRSNNLLAN